MPTNVFFDLCEEKRAKIIDASITEFSEYGYTSGSTNSIVRNAGISKGSLFKYFQSKDELYFYILDCVTKELTTSLEQEASALPQELFERVIKYSELEFTWYMKHPVKCKLIITAFRKDDTAICQKTEARYKQKGRSIYYRLLENIDASPFQWNKNKIVDVLKWFLKGFNEDFIASIQMQNNVDIDSLRQEYAERLAEYIEILKYGFFQGKDSHEFVL